MKKLCVIGAGTMGAGIAQVAASHGIETVISDVDRKFIDKGIETIRGFIGKKLEKNKISQMEHDSILGRISGTKGIRDAVDNADIVIEAVFENMQVKQQIFQELDTLCPEEVILASNTSTLSISEIASVTRHPGRVIGTHFFSPVPVMKLVEVVRGEKTSRTVFDSAMTFCEQIGKTAIAAKDVPGFIVNRFLCLLYNEAANEINDGYATARDIDLGLKLGANHPMGIVELMDLAGVDVVFNALTALYDMTGEHRYKPSPLFRKMVDEGRLGRKMGKGFYEYPERLR
ncbi:MAG: 3-hydroxyacyl-CoA dehydrogenase NAD-binding domain-containing protein [Pseudomonadota bacterium]